MQNTISNHGYFLRKGEVMEPLLLGQASHEIPVREHFSPYNLQDQQRASLDKVDAKIAAQLNVNEFEFQLLKTKHQLL